VNAGLWWPAISWAWTADAPARIQLVIAVCRRVCHDAHGTPARRAAGFSTRLARKGYKQRKRQLTGAEGLTDHEADVMRQLGVERPRKSKLQQQLDVDLGKVLK
jgi:hypothetical protein